MTDKNKQNVYQAPYVETQGYNVNNNGFIQPAVGYQGQPTLQQAPQGFYQPYPGSGYQGQGSIDKKHWRI